jgi:hypothetical protein
LVKWPDPNRERRLCELIEALRKGAIGIFPPQNPVSAGFALSGRKRSRFIGQGKGAMPANGERQHDQIGESHSDENFHRECRQQQHKRGVVVRGGASSSVGPTMGVAVGLEGSLKSR